MTWGRNTVPVFLHIKNQVLINGEKKIRRGDIGVSSLLIILFLYIAI